MEMDLAEGDTVAILDGDDASAPVLARFNGNHGKEIEFVMTTGPMAFIYMDTQSHDPQRGFLLSAKQGRITKSYCVK